MVTAEYIGTPPKNGFYKRQIWVQKALMEKLSANHTMQGKSSVPPKHFYSLEERNDSLVPESNVPQKEYYRVGCYAYRHRDNNDTIAYAHSYPNPSQRNYVYGVLDGPPVDMMLFALIPLPQQVLPCLPSHLLVCGWL